MADQFAAARAYLRNADPVIAALIDRNPDFNPRAWMDQLPKLDAYVLRARGRRESRSPPRHELWRRPARAVASSFWADISAISCPRAVWFRVR
jgi:hypothetical protein